MHLSMTRIYVIINKVLEQLSCLQYYRPFLILLANPSIIQNNPNPNIHLQANYIHLPRHGSLGHHSIR